MHIHIYIYMMFLPIYKYMYIYIAPKIHVYTHAQTNICNYIHKLLFMMYIHIYIYIYMYTIYIYICIHLGIYYIYFIPILDTYIHIYIYIYIYICIYQYNVLWNCIFIHHLPVHGSHPFVWDTFQWFSGAIFWGYTPSHLGAFILILHQLSHTPHWQDLPEAKGRMRRTATRICIGIGARGLVSVVILNDYVQTKELSMGIILYIMGWILFLTRRSSMGIIVYIMG